ncbi:MAG: CvpA family protein [Spirochaetales bacterium]|nr:CvpA family protein [Spirochaetales bacterium]
MGGLATIDIIFIVIIIIAAVRCAFRGFVTEVLSVAAVILGILGAIFLSGLVAGYIDEHFGLAKWSNIVAFLLLFLVIYIIIKGIERGLDRFLERVQLEKLDKSLGLFFGLLEGIIIVGLVIFIMMIQPIFDVERVLTESWFAGVFFSIFPGGTEELKQKFFQTIHQEEAVQALEGAKAFIARYV